MRKTFYMLMIFVLAFTMTPFTLLAETAGQQKALKLRSDKVHDDRNAVIKSTIKAYGGAYYVEDEVVVLSLGGKTYKSFEITIIKSRTVVIRTASDVYYLEVPK